MKRISLFCGHYGSGKTNIAVNYALHLRAAGLPVMIADLDVVNPYFRTKDSEAELAAAGVRVIASAFAGSNVDLPALPSTLYATVEDKNTYAVLDIGGDDRGAYALGRFAPFILEENDYEMFFVVNFYRPLTRTAQDAMAVLREIETACGIPFTAVINNSNLGAITTAEDILATAGECEAFCKLSGLPLAMVSVCDALADRIEGAFPLHLQKRPIDAERG